MSSSSTKGHDVLEGIRKEKYPEVDKDTLREIFHILEKHQFDEDTGPSMREIDQFVEKQLSKLNDELD
jgi:hypothetical protein